MQRKEKRTSLEKESKWNVILLKTYNKVALNFISLFSFGSFAQEQT